MRIRLWVLLHPSSSGSPFMADAIHVQDGCAVINTEHCLSCGMCVVKCPRGAIVDRRGIINRK
ncbi:MAG: 4Fe-4S binding protein [Lachnospiraceae bacterium]|nr:4Fe-4S binding protein [Lachnospiraceae bacterium]